MVLALLRPEGLLLLMLLLLLLLLNQLSHSLLQLPHLMRQRVLLGDHTLDGLCYVALHVRPRSENSLRIGRYCMHWTRGLLWESLHECLNAKSGIRAGEHSLKAWAPATAELTCIHHLRPARSRGSPHSCILHDRWESQAAQAAARPPPTRDHAMQRHTRHSHAWSPST